MTRALFLFLALVLCGTVGAEEKWTNPSAYWDEWKSTTAYPVAYLEPATRLEWRDDKGGVCALDWSDGVCRFTGNADAAARRFFDLLIRKHIQAYIDAQLKTDSPRKEGGK